MTNLLIKKYGLATLALFFCPFLVDASCGDITYYDRGEKAYATVPIEDCANLFNVDEAVGYTPRLIINDFEVSDGETVTVEENEQILIEYNISPERYGSFFGNDLYAKTESGYKQIIFGFGGDYFLDGLPEGDYVAVYISETLTVSDNSLRTWQNKLKDFFLPNIAYAFYEDYQEVTTISFTIEYKTPEPTGASSVLFLPGIMGSKLYEKGQQCGDFGEEQERWFSFSECEQLRLLTRFDGTSVNDIYTMALDEAVIDKIFISSLYDSFLEEMNELEENGEIADFVPFAYDWRLQLDDL